MLWFCLKAGFLRERNYGNMEIEELVKGTSLLAIAFMTLIKWDPSYA